MSKNTRSINKPFNKRAVTAPIADSAWPLPNEFVGVEIEVEDLSGDATRTFPEWGTHSDGSLRNGIEFVLSGPTAGRGLTAAIDKFFDAGLTYSMSERTSIHIHINASDNMTFDQFRNMFVLMYLIEPAVFRWADENRKWCGYCSPLTDLDPSRLVPILTDNSEDASQFVRAVQGGGNSDRYYGYNMAAFARHGTVEFRYFPCTNDKQRVIEWIKFVMLTKRTAVNATDPEAILSACATASGLEGFITSNFGEVAEYIIRNLDFNDAILRVKNLLALFSVAPNAERTGYRSSNSKGVSKLLETKFRRSPTAARAKAKKVTDSNELWADIYRANASGDTIAYQQAIRRLHELQAAETEALRQRRSTSEQTQVTPASGYFAYTPRTSR